MEDESPPELFLRTEELLEQFGWVRNLARRLVADENEAEDLTQETLLTALRSPPHRQRGLRGWLRIVVRNLAISRYRTSASRARRERERTRATEAPSALSVVEQAELHRKVVDAVLSLREPYRTVVLLRFFEEESTASIALRRKTTEATVRSQVKRGLEQLRRKLERDFGGRQTTVFALGVLASTSALRAASVMATTMSSRTMTLSTKIGGMSSRTMTLSTKIGGAFMSTKYIASSIVAFCVLALLGTVGLLTLSDDLAPVRDLARPQVRSGAATRIPLEQVATPVETHRAERVATTSAPVPVIRISPGEIQGRVSSFLGARLEGVEVDLHPRALDPSDFRDLPETEHEAQTQAPPVPRQAATVPRDYRSTTTRADGSFVFSEIPAGTYSVLVHGGDYRPRWIEPVDVYPAEMSQLSIELEKGLGLDGIVVDPDGSPVPGARVLVSDSEIRVSDSLSLSSAPNGWGKELRERLLTVTDASGRFQLSGLPGGIHALIVDHPDWAPTVREIVAGSRELRIELDVPVSFGGIVLDTKDRPVSGATLHTEVGFHGKARRTATSDEKGRFTLVGLPPGGHVLGVEARGFVSESFEFEVAPGDSWDDARIILSPNGSAVGAVVDPGGRPVPGVRLSVGPNEGKFRSVVDRRCDADGHFELSGLRPGETYRILAVHREFATSYVATFPATEGEVDLGRLALFPGAFVAGRVTRGDNLPVARAEVTLKTVATNELGGPRSRSVRTDTEGLFNISGVVAGQYRLRVEVAGLVLQEHDVFVDNDDRELIVDTHFEEGLELTGAVVDANGLPLSGVQVQLREGRHTVGEILTSEEGVFRLSGLTDTKYTLFATKEHFTSITVSDVSSWDSPIELTVTRKGALSGAVRDAETGSQVEDFLLRLPEGPGFDLSLYGATHPVHDPDGRFAFPALDEGTYTVQVKAPGYAISEKSGIEVRSGETTSIEIGLVPGAAIQGAVVDRAGRAIQGARVRATVAKEGKDRSVRQKRTVTIGFAGEEADDLSNLFHLAPLLLSETLTDRTGSFRLSGLSGKAVKLEVTHDRFLPDRNADVNVGREGITELAPIVLDTGARVSGRVLKEQEEPVAHGTVRIRPPGEEDSSSEKLAMVSPDGIFSISGLTGGEYEIDVIGRPDSRTTIEIADDTEETIDLRVAR